MKRVLILGASGGIGRACAANLSQSNNHYELIGVCRRSSDVPGVRLILGDLCDSDFRKSLVRDLNPNYVISCYGRYPGDGASYTSVLNEHTFSVIDIFERFEATGQLEKFVVMSSLSAQMSGITKALSPIGMHFYATAKRLLSEFFRQVQLNMGSRSRIVLIEPGFIRTNFADIAKRMELADPNDLILKLGVRPIEPEYIAAEICRALEAEVLTTSALTFFNENAGTKSILK